MRLTAALILIGGAVAPALPAAAQTPVAVVEDVSGSSAGVGFMDYVAAGKVIRLAAQDTLVLDYMGSCVRETITGGTVTVGAERSTIEAGKVERATVACDAGRMMLTSERANQTAGLVFRGRPPLKPVPAPAPQFTLYGASPVVEATPGDVVVFERIDAAGERLVVTIGETAHGIYDLAKAGDALTPGGVYRADAGTQQMIFRVDPNAKPGPTPVVGRLIRFEPAS